MITADVLSAPNVDKTWISAKPYYVTASLADAAEKWPDRICKISADSQLTYEAAWIKVLRIATWLQQNGVGRGDKVLLAVNERSEVSLIAMAVAHVGAIVSIISKDVDVSDFGLIVVESEPVCVFLDASTVSLRPAAEGVLLTVWLDEAPGTGDWDVPFSELMETSPAFGMRFPGTSQDPAFLVYPKTGIRSGHGLLLSHENVGNMLASRSGAASPQPPPSVWEQVDMSRAFASLAQAA